MLALKVSEEYFDEDFLFCRLGLRVYMPWSILPWANWRSQSFYWFLMHLLLRNHEIPQGIKRGLNIFHSSCFFRSKDQAYRYRYIIILQKCQCIVYWNFLQLWLSNYSQITLRFHQNWSDQWGYFRLFPEHSLWGIIITIAWVYVRTIAIYIGNSED